MNWKLYCLVSGSQCDQFQYPASSDSSSISRAGIRKAMVSYGSAATLQSGCKWNENKTRMILTHNEILVCLVGRFSLLLPSAHESSPRDNSRLDLRKMDLYHHALLSCVSIPHLSHSVSWSTDLQEDFSLYIALCRCNHQLCLFKVARCTSSKIGLMLLSLSVCKIRPFICVKCKTETTFKRAKVVAQDIRIL